MAGAGTQAQLHPLVLLSITDTISRDVTRGHTYPFVGGIVGEVTRAGISLEHTFDIRLKPSPTSTPSWEIDREFFDNRLWQIQEVHKEPAPLDFVAFWTLGKVDQGPGEELRSILPELLRVNENALVVVFHADVMAQGGADERRMPFTIYEPVYGEKMDRVGEGEGGTGAGKEVEAEGDLALPQSFRAVGWEMATGEAEMIGLEFVKNGAGNATRVRTGDTGASAANAAASSGEKSTKNEGSKVDDKDKDKKQVTTATRAAASDLYTPEEEEMLSFLTTRANAIRTLLNRLSSIKSYLDQTQQSPDSASPEVLRAIKAMLARLPGIEAAQNVQLATRETQAAAGATGATADSAMTDALLVELLGSIGKNMQSARELGGKFSAVESTRRERGRPMMGGFGQNSPYGDAGYGGLTDAMDLT